MSTVFVGGSRHVSRLPAEARERLDNIVAKSFPVIVGDASGADKAVQKHLADARYEHVTVFCSGKTCRNNLGQWRMNRVAAPKDAKGFQFYAVKDRAVAREADFGLMVWDGKSAGTVLNVLRLVRAGKKAVLVDVPAKTATTFKSAGDWETFLARSSSALRADLEQRATPEEWQATLPAVGETETAMAASLNAALAVGDPKKAVDLLGHIAKARGMTQVAKTTGLAREALYRALSADGNPEFATVLKVMDSVGLRLTVDKLSQPAGLRNSRK